MQFSYKATLTALQALPQYRKVPVETSVKLWTNYIIALGNPQLAYKVVHVTGTNGKGSVTLKVANALTALGFKTGLYTSPHISSTRERITIDGVKISEQDFVDVYDKVSKVPFDEAIWFDIYTAMGFTYFKD